MFRFVTLSVWLNTRLLKYIVNVKFLCLLISISFIISLVWIQAVDREDQPVVNDRLIEEALENVARDIRYSEVYRKVDKLPKNLKYMLLWTRKDFAPMYFFGNGQRAFLDKNCSVINCYVTADRNFFGGDTKKFDVIAFNGRNIRKTDLPENRSLHQKYLYINLESADNYPVCDSVFDGFFNWTATYRLNSDIPFPYIQIRDINDEVVGPRRDMEWINDDDEESDIDDSLLSKIGNKTKAAAWFVSHCKSRSGRDELVKKIQKELEVYGLSVDVYGNCGTFKCPRHKQSDCDALLERDYYFYMSFENSFDEDYVTEKLLIPLNHYAVPIVFGGADYSRFLPPGSYLDALNMKPEVLAKRMHQLIHSPKLYRKFFRWKKHYTYRDSEENEDVCEVCAAMNDKKLLETPKVYYEFRKWWHPHFEKRC